MKKKNKGTHNTKNLERRKAINENHFVQYGVPYFPKF